MRIVRWSLLVLLAVMSLGAGAGAVGLLAGGPDVFDEDVLADARVDVGYVGAGIALISAVAVPHAVAAGGLWRRTAWGWSMSLAAGLALMTWIFVQVLVIEARFFLQPLCFAIGLVEVALAASRPPPTHRPRSGTSEAARTGSAHPRDPRRQTRPSSQGGQRPPNGTAASSGRRPEPAPPVHGTHAAKPVHHARRASAVPTRRQPARGDGPNQLGPSTGRTPLNPSTQPPEHGQTRPPTQAGERRPRGTAASSEAGPIRLGPSTGPTPPNPCTKAGGRAPSQGDGSELGRRSRIRLGRSGRARA